MKLIKNIFGTAIILTLLFVATIYYFTKTYQDYRNNSKAIFLKSNKPEYAVKVGEVLEIGILVTASMPYHTVWKNEKESKLLKQLENGNPKKSFLDKIYEKVNKGMVDGSASLVYLRFRAEKPGNENVILAQCYQNKTRYFDCINEKKIKIIITE